MKLQREHSLVDAMVEAVPTGILVVGAAGKIVRSNRAAQLMTGYAAAELAAISVDMLVPDAYRAGHQHLRADYGRAPVHLAMQNRSDLTLKTRDGSQLPVSITLAPLALENTADEPLVMVMVRDVTAERENQQNRELLALVANHVDDLIAVLDEDLRVVWANQPYLDFFGQLADQVLGFPIESFVGKQLPASVVREFIEASKAGLAYGDERQFLSANGQRVWLAVAAEQSGRYTVFSAHNTSESHQAAESLMRVNKGLEQRVQERTHDLQQAKEAAEAASRAKSSFLAAMSHEIRTPLHGVIASIDLIDDAALSGSQLMHYRNAGLAAENLSSVLDRVLDFSRIEAGQLTLEKEPTLLRELLETTVAGLNPYAQEKGVLLVANIDPQIDQSAVYTDKRLLGQVINNLLGNAIKFSDSKKVARVTLECELSFIDDENLAFGINIEDTGIGMTAEQVERIFEPFVQADDDTSRRFGGTGLGLAITQKLVRLMGGEVHVVSALNEGSSFSFTLKLPHCDELEPPVLPALTGQNLLVLPGSPELERVLVRYLQSAGARVHVCHNFDQSLPDLQKKIAVAQQKHQRYAAVLVCDLRAETGLLLSSDSRLEMPPLLFIEDSNVIDLSKIASRAAVVNRPLRLGELITGVATLVNAGAVADQPHKDAVPKVEKVSDAAQGLIIAVEDNPLNQELIAAQLAGLGYSYVIAGDGEEALAIYSHGKFALMVTDCHMPGLDGYGLVRKIRQLEAETGDSPPLPIIAMTADVTVEGKNRCFEAGMDDWVTKPMTLKQLGDKIQQWLPVVTVSQNEDGALAPINFAVLDKLIGENPEIKEKMIRLFLTNTPDEIGVMERAVKADALVEFGRAAHKLKSSALSMGAYRFAKACENAERLLAGESAENPASLLEKIQKTYAEITQYIDQHPRPARPSSKT